MTSTAVAEVTPMEILANQVAISLASGKVVRVGRLPLRRTLALARVAAQAAARANAEDVKEASDAAKDKNWGALLGFLDDRTIGELLHVVTGLPADEVLDEFDFPTTVTLIEALVDHNDTAALRRVFTKAASKPSPPTSTESSSAPST